MTLRPASDPAAAQWVQERMHGFGRDVGSIVPSGFDAYARVFHPAQLRIGPEETRGVTWREIAEANGKIVHPEMQFEFIVPDDCFDDAKNLNHGQPGLWDWSPSDGELEDDLARTLATLLREHTTTPDPCCFAYWEGWGDPVPLMPSRRGLSGLPDRWRRRHIATDYQAQIFAGHPRAQRDDAAHFELPGRGYYLFEGPIEDVTTGWHEGGELPSLWWPQDLVWCVATEIDFDTTYVGGSKECIAAIVASPELEALETSVDHRIGRPSDTINTG